MGAFKRSDWNDIIDRANGLINTCNNTEVTPLNHVSENHIWTRADIEAVRSKLTELCSNASFSAPLIKWTQAIISELNAATENCECKESNCKECEWNNQPFNPYTPATPPDYTFSASMSPVPFCYWQLQLANEIIGTPGYLGRYCWVIARNEFASIPLGTMTISCQSHPIITNVDAKINVGSPGWLDVWGLCSSLCTLPGQIPGLPSMLKITPCPPE